MSAEFIRHSGLIRSDDLKQGVPLQQSEITQFINTMDAEVFEKKTVAAAGSFKPKSLFDLAKAASERDGAQSLEAEVLPHDTEELPETPQKPNFSDNPKHAPTPERMDAPPLGLAEDADADQHLLTNAGPIALEPEREEHGTTVAAIEEAYQRGLLDGQKFAETEVEDMMAHALGLLTQVTQSFALQVDGATEDLAASIEASVLSLASSRAGMAIDAMPEAFIQRIKTLANRIQKSVTQPLVRLHPLDLLVLKPIFEQSTDLLNLRLIPDATLQRGDIDLSLEDIRLTDVLPRIDLPAQHITYTPLILAADADTLQSRAMDPEVTANAISATDAEDQTL